MAKKDELSHDHLQWLVQSRTANQTSCLKLFKLMEEIPRHGHKNKPSTKNLKMAQDFVSAIFSLWRAAFLADREGTRELVLDDAKAFLGKLLTDNAINYAQDRGAREFTFNYYMVSANDSLLRLGQTWPNVTLTLNDKAKNKNGLTLPQRRWLRTHNALETALECLEKDLSNGSL